MPKSELNLEGVKYLAYLLSDYGGILVNEKNSTYEITFFYRRNESYKLLLKKIKFLKREIIINQKIFGDKNIKLKEYMLRNSFLYNEEQTPKDDFALSLEEEEELKKLIEEVEREIKKNEKK